MPQPATAFAKFQFGVFEVDVEAREIRKHGIRLKLQDAPFKVLILLMERQGQVVSREEIRRLLWSDGTFVDFEHSISSAVNKIRVTLSDSAANPRYIETLGRHGYRFIYPVTQPAARIVTELEPAIEPPSQGNGRRNKLSFRIAIWTAAFAVIFSLWSFISSRSHTEPSRIRSIAVMPLKNLSNDSNEEFFSEGLTDELVTRLASLDALRVVSRTSTMQYRNGNKSLPEIAKELHVDAVLEGSVLRSEEKVRITVQLVEALSDKHIWAHSYERDHRDLLVLQNDVTRDIAENIALKLQPADQRRLSIAATVDPQAHEAYLRGRYYYARRRVSDLKTAAEYFEQAIKKDPEYALAYAGLADCYALLGGYSLSPQDTFIPKARAAATKALSLDPSLSQAHEALAVIAQNYDYDWKVAEAEYRRAIELDPNNAAAHHWYAEFLSYHARFNEAFAEIDRARQLDPFSLILLTDRAVILYYARRYDESEKQFQEVLARDPEFPRASMILQVYVEKGRFDEALRLFDQAAKAPNDVGITAHQAYIWGTRAFIYGRAGRRNEAMECLQRLQHSKGIEKLDPYAMLPAYIALGDRDKAFATLERAYSQHSTALTSLKVNPLYDNLRSDPRFAELLQRMNL
jgi:TolB-like protein/DNA-binding winged helix-turn-helix (wHTH) protein/Flp pilus assembly protein TadD